MNYSVNIESLHKNFPADFTVPSLLLEFGSWLESKRYGSVGCFSLESERFNDYWIENGADLHPYFAFFMSDPTGGQIGYWLSDGRTTVSPPIALVGSEGELNILSGSLEEFLNRLAEGNTQADDLDSRDEGGTESAELTKWLESRTGKSAIQNDRDHLELQAWMDEWGQQQRDWIDKDTFHLQIADKLRKFVKPNAKPWETADFDVWLVGTHFKMWHSSYGPKPMAQTEISDLEPLFRSVREQRVAEDSGTRPLVFVPDAGWAAGWG